MAVCATDYTQTHMQLSVLCTFDAGEFLSIRMKSDIFPSTVASTFCQHYSVAVYLSDIPLCKRKKKSSHKQYVVWSVYRATLPFTEKKTALDRKLKQIFIVLLIMLAHLKVSLHIKRKKQLFGRNCSFVQVLHIKKKI